jgi:ubiquinone/menaquinone biosynthesis C-methylase UbiE
MSGWQLSGDAPSLYIRFAATFMKPWTDDLIRQAKCTDGDRVLDLACGTGFVATRVNEVSGAMCQIAGLDVNEGMLNAARRDTSIDWRLGRIIG